MVLGWVFKLSAGLAMLYLAGAAAAGERPLLGYPGSPEQFWGRLGQVFVESGGDAIDLDPVPLAYIGGDHFALMALKKEHLALVVLDITRAAVAVPELAVLALPLLVRDVEHGQALVRSGLGEELDALAQARGFKVVGYVWRVGTFVSNKGCLTTLGDFAKRRILAGSPPYQRMLQMFGAETVTFGAAAFAQATAKGVADSGLFSLEALGDPSMATPYGKASDCLTNPMSRPIMVVPDVILARRDYWENRLGDDEREALRRAAEVVADKGRCMLEETMEYIVNNLYRRVEEISPEDYEAWRSWVRARYADLIGDIPAREKVLKLAQEAFDFSEETVGEGTVGPDRDC